jgi:hypothetical protein
LSLVKKFEKAAAAAQISARCGTVMAGSRSCDSSSRPSKRRRRESTPVAQEVSGNGDGQNGGEGATLHQSSKEVKVYLLCEHIGAELVEEFVGTRLALACVLKL